MLEIRFMSGKKEKTAPIVQCLKEASDSDTGRNATLDQYVDEADKSESWGASIDLPGRIHDATLVIDLDKVPRDAFRLYTELSGKASADAMLAGIEVRSINEIQ